MRNAKIRCILFAVLIASMKPLQAQLIERQLTNEQKYAVIKSSAQLLNDHYLFPHKAKQVEQLLTGKFNEGAFDKVVDPKAFGKQVQGLMQEVTRDKHLRLLYAPALVKNL